MVREVQSDDDIYTTGTCVCCGRWGPAFSFCGYCGEHTGRYYQAEEGVDYTVDSLRLHFESDIEVETKSEESKISTTMSVKKSHASEEDKSRLNKPTYIRNWHPQRIKDVYPFDKLSMSNLFELVYDDITEIKLEIMMGGHEEYIRLRCLNMKEFGYHTALTVLQNQDNLIFNIKSHNDNYKLISSGTYCTIKPMTELEHSRIVVWGIHLLQSYALDISNHYF
jgi:hypothetical protein